MNTGADISTLYREFTDALTEVLAESAGGLAPRAARKSSRGCQEASRLHRVWTFCGGENAFKNWEALQNAAR